MKRLGPDALCRSCNAEALDFETTATLEELDGVLGQDRAVDAIRFAVEIGHPGYNVFVLGPTGTGRHHLVQRVLEQKATLGPVPDDWCYVHHFPDPFRPRVLRLPPGRGVELREAMARLVEDLSASIPAAFDSEAYRGRRQSLERDFESRREEAFATLRAEAETQDVILLFGPKGFALVPAKGGEPIDAAEMEKLPEAEQAAIQNKVEEVQEQLHAVLHQIPRWVSEQQEALRALDRETSTLAVEHLVEDLRAHWTDLPDVLEHLTEVAADIIDHAARFRGDEAPQLLVQAGLAEDGWARRYEVNLLVDRSGDTGAPLIYEDNPTLQALAGRVEHHARLGTLVTDFTLIRAGALHRANGGFLVLDARKVLTQPLAWDFLKRTLRSGEVRIESLAQALSLASTVSLEPQAIPLNLRVVLVGDRRIYYLLASLDPEFQLLFKVPADVEHELDRTPDTANRYARLVASLARQDGLLPFDRGGVAQVITRASRLAGDQHKLTTHMDSLTDLLLESDHHARSRGAERVGAEDVREAIAQERRRHGRVHDRSLEQMVRGTLHIETSGTAVGQVNGLSVLPLGRATFGRPGRITARVRMGRGQVLDIEREVKLGGPVHSKGVLILSGFVGARYATDQPFALSASIVFEQSYGGVEGDSASLAETLALLSACAEVPVRQDIAVTGSIDQHGAVQAVGGVNDKVEGFFDLCQARGLTGTQGVVIPQANADHLMLREEVVAAAAEDRFHVWTVETVDEALALLTGLEAGERDAEGHFPNGTVNARVEARLLALADQARAFARADEADES